MNKKLLNRKLYLNHEKCLSYVIQYLTIFIYGIAFGCMIPFVDNSDSIIHTFKHGFILTLGIEIIQILLFILFNKQLYIYDSSFRIAFTIGLFPGYPIYKYARKLFNQIGDEEND